MIQLQGILDFVRERLVVTLLRDPEEVPTSSMPDASALNLKHCLQRAGFEIDQGLDDSSNEWLGLTSSTAVSERPDSPARVLELLAQWQERHSSRRVRLERCGVVIDTDRISASRNALGFLWTLAERLAQVGAVQSAQEARLGSESNRCSSVSSNPMASTCQVVEQDQLESALRVQFRV